VPGRPALILIYHDTVDFPSPGTDVAFTMYLGVSGITDSNTSSPGILFWGSTNRLVDITDGTSNTLMVGERPPSKDLEYGWWFAGAGYSNGTGDVVLGARETGFAAALGCSSSYANFQQGSLNSSCDQAHFWSLHSGGANFLRGDGSVRFVTYSINNVMPQICTRNGGEVVADF